MSSPPKVLFVVSSAEVGGAERYCVSLLRGLRAAGAEVQLACPRSGPMLPEYRAAAAGTHPLDLSRVYDPRAARKLARLIQENRSDVVHTHLWNADALGALASAQVRGAAFVSTVYGAYYLPSGARGLVALRRRAQSRSFRTVYRAFDRVIAVSDYVAQDLRTRAGVRVSERSLAVVRPGVDLEAAPPRPRGTRPPRVVCVANFHVGKGHEFLLRALPLVLARFPAARCVLVGDGPERRAMERLALTLEVSEAVEFTGTVADPSPLVADSDLFVLPSLSEGLPLSVLEAWALGVPVVASRVGGLSELVEDGKDGLLVPVGEPEPLAQAIGAVLSDPGLASRLSAGGRNALAGRFSASRMTDEVLGVYRAARSEAAA